MKIPTKPTLQKYGLTEESFLELAITQAGACALCGTVPGPGKMGLVIDHEHVRGYKNLPPEERAARVRGLLCWWDNHMKVGRNDLISARRLVAYLEAYEKRRPTATVAPRRSRSRSAARASR